MFKRIKIFIVNSEASKKLLYADNMFSVILKEVALQIKNR